MNWLNLKMMKTPILDFVKSYQKHDMTRLHMPGHKGYPYLGWEPFDITEIAGADVLSDAAGIIEESEMNASSLFGTAHTFYSTEGSSLVIKTMLSLVLSDRDFEKRPVILAARNAHKSFLYSCALLDVDVTWLYPEDFTNLCSCPISPSSVEMHLSSMKEKPAAVYLTSPDYLGNSLDIQAISKVCDDFGVPLLVDNAHGAYTKFLKPGCHPIDLGATMCADSAHKTLPVLTGGAYLHISKKAPVSYLELARNSMAVFASTSPSYLILQSLDFCNRYLSDGYEKRLSDCISKVERVKGCLRDLGFPILDSEPLKLVIDTLACGYNGEELANQLRLHRIEIEFADPEYLVLMFTPEITARDYERLLEAFHTIPLKNPLQKPDFVLPRPDSILSIRRAVFGKRRRIPVTEALGMICAAPCVSCPPAIPILVSGERITEEAIRLFQYYGVETVEVCQTTP